VKVSRRIAQFLLVLLEYERTEVDQSLSLLLRSSRFQLESLFFGRTHHFVPDKYGRFKVSNTVRSSFNRTIRIMQKQGLISSWHGLLSSHDATTREDSVEQFILAFYNITLTDKGRKTALALEKEVRRYIKDFSLLLNRKTTSKHSPLKP
jgi:hypothetical protein